MGICYDCGHETYGVPHTPDSCIRELRKDLSRCKRELAAQRKLTDDVLKRLEPLAPVLLGMVTALREGSDD